MPTSAPRRSSCWRGACWGWAGRSITSSRPWRASSVTLGRYAFTVLLLVAGTLALLAALLPLDAPSRRAIVFGGALAALNALVAYYLVLWSERRPTADFLRAVLGGMVGR